MTKIRLANKPIGTVRDRAVQDSALPPHTQFWGEKVPYVTGCAEKIKQFLLCFGNKSAHLIVFLAASSAINVFLNAKGVE